MNKKDFDSTESEVNLDLGYDDILEISNACKFSNCTHTSEPGCAVQKAIDDGVISVEKFNNYYKEKNETEYISKQKNKTKAIDYMKQRKLFKRNS